MAVSRLHLHEVSDLCIGKPPLRSLPASATVSDALSAICRASVAGDPAIAVWPLDSAAAAPIGRLCMVDLLLHLCADDNIADPDAALAVPVAALIPKGAAPLRRVEPNDSVLEALDAILEGAQSVVVPIRSSAAAGRKKFGGGGGEPEFCWLTVEDLVRFFLNFIAFFSPAALMSISELGVVRPVTQSVHYSEPALAAIPLVRAALASQSSVAVLSDDGFLVGEISPSMLCGCDESVAAAMVALSAGDLVAYIDCRGAPPDSLVAAVRLRLKERGLLGMMELLDSDTLSMSSASSAASLSSSSSDDEEGQSGGGGRSRGGSRVRRSVSCLGRAEETSVCHRGSSLVAVMIQAVAHRVGYVWVVDDDERVVGMVKLADILGVLREKLQ